MDAEPLQSFHSFYSFSFFIQKYRYFFSGLIFLGDGQHNLINLTGFFLGNESLLYYSPLIVLSQDIHNCLRQVFYFHFCELILRILLSLLFRL